MLIIFAYANILKKFKHNEKNKYVWGETKYQKKKNTPGLNVQSWGGGGRERTAKSIEQR